MTTPKAFANNAANRPRKLGAPAYGTSVRASRTDHVHPAYGLEQLLFSKRDLNMNATTDQQLNRIWDPGVDQDGAAVTFGFIITRIRFFNASISLTTAQGGIYTSPSKAGVALMATTHPYTGLTGATLGIDATLAAAALDELSAGALYLSLTTAQGAAATASCLVLGIPYLISDVT